MRERGKGRSAFFLLSFTLLLFPALAARPAEPDWTVVLSGDADGYLAPCGCTSPMQGGMKRRGTALHGGERLVRLDNGGLAGGLDRQSVLKGETAAQALARADVDAANLNAGDARLGVGAALSLARLSGNRLVSTSLRTSATLPVPAWREAGPFLIGGATARPDVLASGLREETIKPEEAADRLVREAEGRGLAPILLFDGSRTQATALAQAVPALRLVTYRSTGRPPAVLDAVGTCALASPGERGKGVARLVWRGDRFVSATLQTLGPEIPDDTGAKALYDDYLREVTREGLLDKAPHVPSGGFSGNARCGSCHGAALKVWKASGHAHALATLEGQDHGRDPDCVPCHVVGSSPKGSPPTMAFRSRTQTPQLADVGCESCHGAGAAHSANPLKVSLPKIGRASCKPCHTLENSPNFDFDRYWAKVRHGGGASNAGLSEKR